MFLCDSCLGCVTIFFIISLSLIKIFNVLTVGISKSNTCLVGKTVLITGGNSGLGYETALALAGRGARVIIADKDDATKSVNNIMELTNNRNVLYKHLNLSSLKSVRQFTNEIKVEEDRLDILINNAGGGRFIDKYTEDNLQLGMQVNYLGAFLLTHLLIDLLKKSAPSRILFVSSLYGFMNNVTVDNLNEYPKYKNEYIDSLVHYGNTKVMNIIAANIFAEKLLGSKVTSNSLHPGIVITPIWNSIDGLSFNMILKFILYIYLKVCGKTAWEGAQTHIECALSKDLENTTGKYFGDCKQCMSPRKVKNKELCEELWKKSEDLVKLEEHEKIK